MSSTFQERVDTYQAVDRAIDEYLADYEFRGDNGDYSPNEHERLLLQDAIAGLLVDEDFLKAFRGLENGT